jgi:hypothetical protein
MSNFYDAMVLLFSILIFLFATRESVRHVRGVMHRIRAEKRVHKLGIKRLVNSVSLMLISAGPAGYYALHLLDALISG